MQYETVHDRDTSYYRTHGVPPNASIASGNGDTTAGCNEDEKERRDASWWKEKERWGIGGERERESDVERRKIEKWERKETEGQNEGSERRQREVNDYVARVR